MNHPKLTQVALAVVGALSALSAQAANQTVYVSGASAPTQAIFRAFAANCTDTTLPANGKPNVTVYTSGTKTGLPGSLGNELAYQCVFKATAGAFANDTVTMFHTVAGGSFNAFAPHLPTNHDSYPGNLNQPELPQPLNAALTCTNVADPADTTLDVDSRNACTVVTTTPFVNVYDGGFSDVEPAMWSATLLPDGTHGYDAEAMLALFPTAAAGVQQAFGVAVTETLYRQMQVKQINDGNLPASCSTVTPATLAGVAAADAAYTPGTCQPSLAKTDYAAVVANAGAYHTDWQFLLGAAGAGKDVNLCRRVPTSGTQATSNYEFLATPCSLNPVMFGAKDAADANWTGTTFPAGTFNVFAGLGTGNVKDCLARRNAGNNPANAADTSNGTFGMGFMSMENSVASGWKFVKLNSVSPDVDAKHRKQAALGNYDTVSEMVYLVADATYQNFFDLALVKNMSDTSITDPTGLMITPSGTTALPLISPDGDKVARGTRTGNSCSTFYRVE